jgi:hypothetical protein
MASTIQQMNQEQTEQQQPEQQQTEQQQTEQKSEQQQPVPVRPVAQPVAPQRCGGKMAYYMKPSCVVQDDDDDLDQNSSSGSDSESDGDSDQGNNALQLRQRCSDLAQTICTSVKGQRDLLVEHKAVFDRLAGFRKIANAAKKALKVALVESKQQAFRSSSGDFDCTIVQKKKRQADSDDESEEEDEQPEKNSRIVIKIKREKPAKRTKGDKRKLSKKSDKKSVKRTKIADSDNVSDEEVEDS